MTSKQRRQKLHNELLKDIKFMREKNKLDRIDFTSKRKWNKQFKKVCILISEKYHKLFG